MRTCVALLLALATTAAAHQLHAEARLEGGEVLLEVYFSDGATPAGARIEVRAAGGEQVLAEGLTDERGRFRWRPTAPGTYWLDVSEPGLHKARAEVVVASVVGEATAAVSTAAVDTGATAAPSSASAAPASERGATPWKGIAGGLALIAALAGGLALAQRKGGAP